MSKQIKEMTVDELIRSPSFFSNEGFDDLKNSWDCYCENCHKVTWHNGKWDNTGKYCLCEICKKPDPEKFIKQIYRWTLHIFGRDKK